MIKTWLIRKNGDVVHRASKQKIGRVYRLPEPDYMFRHWMAVSEVGIYERKRFYTRGQAAEWIYIRNWEETRDSLGSS